MNEFLRRYVNSEEKGDFIEIENGRYVNRLFQLSFEIPKSWHVLKLEKFDKMARKQKLKESLDFLKDSLYNVFGHPCLVLTKYNPDSNELDGVVSPTINFSIINKDSEPNTTLKEYALQLDLQEDESILNKFKVTNIGKEFELKGHKRIIVDTEYLFEHTELDRPVMVEMKVLNIDYNDFYLDFSMTQCKNQNQTADTEFEEFMKSIILNE